MTSKVTATKRIGRGGGSFVLFVSRECKMMDIGPGDVVNITMEVAYKAPPTPEDDA